MSLVQFHVRGFYRVFLALTALSLLCFLASAARSSRAAAQCRIPRARVQKKTTSPPKPRVDYSRFSHRTHVITQKLECSSCHKVPSKNWKEVRKGEAAFQDVTDFPEHSSCLNCHREQFFARERPAPVICFNCHIAVSPRDTTRWLFPSLGDVTDPKLKRRELVSEFGVGFPHDKHLDVVGFNLPASQNRALFVNALFQEKKPAPPKSCPVCHETYQPQGKSSEEYVTRPPKNIGDNFWLKKGTFKMTPSSHTVCFSCHNADLGIPPAPSDCSLCHKFLPAAQTLKVDFDPKVATDMGIIDKTMLRQWSRRISSGTFRHEGGDHPNLSCLGCHNVPTMNTLDVKSLRVPARSCGGAEGCHITATTDDGGILNYEIDQKKTSANFVCAKCHITFGREGVPVNHLEAIPKAIKK